MDLAEALKLAKKGKGQAETAAAGHASSLEPGVKAEDDGPDPELPVKVPEPPDLRLTRAEWYGHVSNVAKGIAEATGRPHWYDLDEKEREELREQAVAAILAVGSANIALRQRRMVERHDPIVHRDVPDDLEADLDLGGDVKARAAVRRQRSKILDHALAADEAAA